MSCLTTATAPATTASHSRSRSCVCRASSSGTQPQQPQQPQRQQQAVQAAPQQARPSGAATRRAALAAVVAGIAAVQTNDAQAAGKDAREGEVRHTEGEWRGMLSPARYAVLRQASTEPRYSSPLVDEHRTGTFCCAGCAAPLFAAETKFESGTGWPSFFDALPGAVALVPDNKILFMPRTEVRCQRCQSHIGHVFDDGPPPTGKRYCMNGLALQFQPASA